MKKTMLITILSLVLHLRIDAYYSQFSQDEFIHQHFFHQLKNGIFVDIGAHDGVSFSNTYFFEKKLGWKGICFEPIPEVFAELQKNRKCVLIQGCVADRTGTGNFLRVSSPHVDTEMLSGLLKKYDPRHLDRIGEEIKVFGGDIEVVEVQCYLLHEQLALHGINHINYLSIDIEGGEFDVIKTIDFSKIRVDVISVEDNYEDSELTSYLEKQGFQLVKKMECDLIFVSDKLDSKQQ